MTEISATSQEMITSEISAITGKEHKNVIRDTEKMFSELGEDRLKFEHIYKDSYGREQKCYKLDKTHSLCLVAKYDTKTRMAIIKRWEELEKTGRQLADALKNADPAVLRKLADVSEQAQKLEQNNRILETSLECAEETIKNIKPMAEYGQKIFNSKNTYTATNVADELGMSANKLNTILRQRGVIKRGTGSADYSICSKFKKYDLAVHLNRPITHSNGEVETKLQLRWTRKGFDWLIAQLGEKQEKGA
jgi:phage antirepressor YoqD-like protein